MALSKIARRMAVGAGCAAAVLLSYKPTLEPAHMDATNVPEPPVKKAIVIGGGIAGICTAYSLNKKGIETTVLDSSHALAFECSRATAGGMQKSNPRVDPATWIKTVKSFFLTTFGIDKTLQTFHINMKDTLFDPHFWRWFASFTRASFLEDDAFKTHKQHELLRFTDWAIDRMLAAMQSHPRLAQASHVSREGVVKLLYTDQDVQASATPAANGAEPYQALSWEEAIAQCPSLEAVSPPKPVDSVLHQTSAAHAFCRGYALELAKICEADGVTFRTNTKVNQIERDRSDPTRVAKLVLSDGTELSIEAGTAVVIAAGSWTPHLGKMIDIHVPVYPMKGYSVIAQLNEGESTQNTLSHVVIEPHQNLYVTRFDNELRVASIGEFAGWDTRPQPDIAQQLKQAAMAFMPTAAEALAKGDVVCGLRPFVADGAPLIGAVPGLSNVYLNVGPGFNGWKIAMGTGELTARCVTKMRTDDLPFDASVMTCEGRM